MARQVSAVQYDRLVEARNNWPDRLYYGVHSDRHGRPPQCTLEYLADRIGTPTVTFFDLISGVSRSYGIPALTLGWWVLKNDYLYLYFSEQRRARGMLGSFQNFLKKVAPVSETSNPINIGQMAQVTS